MLIGLQLWSVGEEMSNDFFKTLTKVAKMGYDGVEFAGYHGHDAKTIKEKLDQLGLKVAASHISIERLREDLDAVIAFEKTLGNQYIVCPYATYETADQWLAFAKELAEINQKITAAGLTFAYHNHAHELVPLADKYVLDVLFDHVSGTEIDVYWLAAANLDPVTYLAQYKDKTPLVHIKDMDANSQESTIIGTGTLDIKNIVKQAKTNGAKWLIIEQESFTKPPLASVEAGLVNLKEVLNKC